MRGGDDFSLGHESPSWRESSREMLKAFFFLYLHCPYPEGLGPLVGEFPNGNHVLEEWSEATEGIWKLHLTFQKKGSVQAQRGVL